MKFGKEEKQSLIDITNAGLTKFSKGSRNGNIWPSSAYCSRLIALTSNFENTSIITPAQNSYMSIGVAVEDLLIHAWKQQEILLFEQYRLPDVGLNVRGYIDAVIYLHGQVYVVEVKSCSKLPSKPNAKHESQALIYSIITGLPAKIVYFSRSVADWRGNLQMRVFDLESVEESKKRAVFQQVVVGYISKERGVIPPRPFEKVGDGDNLPPHCEYCDFEDYCWQSQEKPIDLPEIQRNSNEFYDIILESSDIVDEIMERDTMRKRRNGVLKFLSQNAQTVAGKNLKNAKWPE